MANPYSIHLIEPLSLEAAQRVANETASQLGGTPDKLAQLLTRNSGSRIARASSAAQADRVASILRKAGVTVQVVDPENTEAVSSVQNLEPNVPEVPSAPPKTPAASTDSLGHSEAARGATGSNYDVNAGSSSAPSGNTPIVPDEIIPIDEPPFTPLSAPKNPTPMPDSFSEINTAAPKNDPFASDSKDLFNPEPSSFNPAPDPFAAPALDQTRAVNDPFAPPTRAGLNASANDPFAAPKNDPFAAPKNDPFASSSAQDPFAPAAGVIGSNPETPLAYDPFAQSQAPSAVSELPAQALKAQNRSTRRTSIRSQMLSGLILPVLLVGLLTALYLNYQIPITMQRFLTARAKAASSVLASRLISDLSNTEGVSQKALLDKLTTETRNSVPDSLFVAVSTVGNNNKIVSNSADATQDVKKINDLLDGQSVPLTEGAVFEVNNQSYIAYAVPIRNAIGKPLGTVVSGIDYNVINTEKLNLFVPLFIALILIILIASVFAAILASRLVRPIIAAADQANRISLGDLERTVDIQSNDEVGDLLGSLERMRVSLKSVIGRLRRDR